MRIIAGKYKGIPLVSFQADHIRPTTDRVKESLFNIWRGSLEDARVIDLFSGTGSLGLESLSRGAREVTFVDAHPKSLDILRQNLAKLKIESDVNVVKLDVFRFLKGKTGAETKAVDLIFIDPPFTEKIADVVMTALSETKLFHEDTLIAIESSRKEKIVDDYGPLYRYDVREFGDKILSLFRMRPAEVRPTAGEVAEDGVPVKESEDVE